MLTSLSRPRILHGQGEFMEFLKNLGTGALAAAIIISIVALLVFLGAVVLTFNDWLYYNHQPFWPIFWGAIGVGLLAILLAGVGGKIRSIQSWE